LGAFKSYTSKALQKEMEVNVVESRKKPMLWMMEKAGMKESNVKKKILWQHHNKSKS